MSQILLLIHVLIAIALIALVLLQQGKGAEIGAAFGSGASQTVFGSQGSGSFLSKVTLGLAACFFATSLVLGHLASKEVKQNQSVALLSVPVKRVVPVSAPVQTVPVAPVQK